VKAQRNLLETAVRQLKPGGALIYSTCSLESEENESLIAGFVAQRGDFKLEESRWLLPFRDGVDGAYVARLRMG
jgi:16S rRNA (cytosine967-C5)-methyltransferase